jgi:hypothetical protein
MSYFTTTWHRLEPRVRGRDPARGLRAAVHDPLWLLGRQWQVGELLGEDAGSPIAVRVETVEFPFSRFRPFSGEPTDYDAALPLEVIVEREPPPAPTLRQRLDAWTRLADLLAAEGVADLLPELAAAHPLPAPAVPGERADARLRRLAGPNVGDGISVALAWSETAPGLPGEIVPTSLSWYRAQFPSGAGDSWVTDRLEYRFAVGGAASDVEVVLESPEYLGGRLDWFDLDWVDLDTDTGPANSLAAPANAGTTELATVLPTRVAFPGMPAERFWEFEDAVIDFGSVSSSADDLGRLLAVEFATVFGNDWWQVPVRGKFGSLIGVRSLVVRDTFGANVLIDPTEQSTPQADASWRMFRPTDSDLGAGSGPLLPLLVLPPVVAGSLEGDPVEELLLLRDEMANLGWGIERIVEGADGRPRNRSIDYGTSLSAATPPDVPSPAELIYLLQTMVPEHWIPLVPVRDPNGTSAIVLQRGSLLTQDGTNQPIPPQGVLLAPAVKLWFFHEEEVPREGLRIARIPSLTRGVDGTPFAWVSRRVGVGRGEGSSGLRFDLTSDTESPSI